MTVKQLADYLLSLESAQDLPVGINGWGSDAGLGPFEVIVGELTSFPSPYLALEHGQLKIKRSDQK